MHIRNITTSIAQKTSLIRKCFKALDNNDTILTPFYAFILPYFKYCSPVWCYGFNSLLRLLDPTLGNIRFLPSDLSVDLKIKIYSSTLYSNKLMSIKY